MNWGLNWWYHNPSRAAKHQALRPAPQASFPESLPYLLLIAWKLLEVHFHQGYFYLYLLGDVLCCDSK